MSDTMTSGGGAPQSGAAPSAEASTISALQQGASQPSEQQAEPSEFANGFLSRVDPAHRSIVAPYVNQWDAGVTRRFQELHGQLQPYEALGADPETLSSAYQLYQMIDQDPQQVMTLLQDLIGQQGQPGSQPAGQQLPQGQQPSPLGGEPQQAPGLPPEFQQKFQLMEQVLETMAQQHLDTQKQQQEAQEDQQLDQYLGLLKKEYGDFNEQYVLAQMMSGKDGEEAVQAYMSEIQGQVNQRSQRPNVPQVLGGGGSVPPDGQRIASASRKDIKGLVANILASSQQQ